MEQKKIEGKYIHEIKLKGKDDFAKQFNDCSDWWAKATDETLTEEQRKDAMEIFMAKRWCLEMGG